MASYANDAACFPPSRAESPLRVRASTYASAGRRATSRADIGGSDLHAIPLEEGACSDDGTAVGAETSYKPPPIHIGANGLP